PVMVVAPTAPEGTRAGGLRSGGAGGPLHAGRSEGASMSNYPPSSDPWSGEGERGTGERGPSAPPLASWGQRFAAWLIDALIGSVPLAIGYFLSPTADGFLWLGYLGKLAFVLWNLARQGTTG